MILTGAGQTFPFIPPWLANSASPPTFHLRTGTLAERDLFEAELAGTYNAGLVYDFALRAAALSGVRALGGDDVDDLVELVTEWFGDGGLPPDRQARADALFGVLAQHWPEYGQLRQQQARRMALMPTLAFKRWCAGWDNVTDSSGEPLPFVADRFGQPEESAMRRLPQIMLAAAGAEAFSLQMGRGTATEKN